MHSLATARLQECADWLAFDAGQDNVAWASYSDALTLARQADDREVEIWRSPTWLTRAT